MHNTEIQEVIQKLKSYQDEFKFSNLHMSRLLGIPPSYYSEMMRGYYRYGKYQSQILAFAKKIGQK